MPLLGAQPKTHIANACSYVLLGRAITDLSPKPKPISSITSENLIESGFTKINCGEVIAFSPPVGLFAASWLHRDIVYITIYCLKDNGKLELIASDHPVKDNTSVIVTLDNSLRETLMGTLWTDIFGVDHDPSKRRNINHGNTSQVLRKMPNINLGASIVNQSIKFRRVIDDIYSFNMEDFIDETRIYSGSNGRVVNKYTHEPTNKQVIIKTIPITQARGSNITENIDMKEVEMLKKVTIHENIVDFYGMTIGVNGLLICMEYMDMSLLELCKNIHTFDKEIEFPEIILGKITVSIIDALNFCYCQQEKIMHRDVKPGNILLNWNGEIKLADFGIARGLPDSLATTFAGTLIYMAPERITNFLSPYDIRSDVWSLGITLLECIYFKHPYIKYSANIDSEHIEHSTILRMLNKFSIGFAQIGASKLLEEFPPIFSENFLNFLKLCLEEIDKRPKYDALIKTEFYNAYKDISKKDISKNLEKYRRN